MEKTKNKKKWNENLRDNKEEMCISDIWMRCVRETVAERNKMEHRKSIIKLTNEKYKFVWVFLLIFLYIAWPYLISCRMWNIMRMWCILNVAFTNIKWYMEYGNLMTMLKWMHGRKKNPNIHTQSSPKNREPSPRTHAQCGNCGPLFAWSISGVVWLPHPHPQFSTDGGNKTYFG